MTTNARGQRNPRIAEALESVTGQPQRGAPRRARQSEPEPEERLTEIEPQDDELETYQPDEDSILLPGDTIEARVSAKVEGNIYTYGVGSQVQPGETEQEAFSRVSLAATARVGDLIFDGEEVLLKVQDALDKRQIRVRR